jgi:phage shock protein A
MFKRFMALFSAMMNSAMGKMESPEMMLEQTCQELNEQVQKVEQAVVQAMATEKQLERELAKNKKESETWHQRATTAVQGGNDELARQALQRKQQFAQAAADLETQLAAQKESTVTLRNRLQELKTEVQKANTKKSVIVARHKAATATAKANEIMSKTSADGAMSTFERMEQKVAMLEAKSQAMSDLASDQLGNNFKKFEEQMDIEAELMALKGNSGNGPKLIVQKDVKQISAKSAATADDTVDAEEVTDIR